ncbi:MAG TPA: TonB-dependent receptor [Steroidobacter sp.]
MKNSRKSMLVTMVVSGTLLAAQAAGAQQGSEQEPPGNVGPGVSENTSPSTSSGSAPMQADEGLQEVQTIVVTGSRIAQAVSAAPITSVSAADIKIQGVVRIEDMVNSLPQAFGSQGSGVSNRSNGTATVNLRGLGAARTLVLIDGKRLMAGNPTSSIGPVAADLNFIPSALVKRVDVLTGGASAVYGADAVAGVVNFVMDRDFQGLRVDAQSSIYQHSQHNSQAQQALRASRATSTFPEDYQIPGDTTDGRGVQLSITAGANIAENRGNITAYATYLNIDPITADARDYSSCALNSGASFVAAGCGGSGTAYPARIDPIDPDGAGPRTDPGNFIVNPTGPGNTFRTRLGSDLYNFAPLNHLQRPDERFSMGAFVRYDITPSTEAYMDTMYMKDTSTALIAPAGIFAASGPGPGGTYQINCNNPLMTLQQQQQLCGPDAGTPTLVNALIARRNIEGGGRPTQFDHNEQRHLFGVRGELTPDWKFDSYFQYGQTTLDARVDNYFITSRVNRALLATRDSSGNIVCYDRSDGCVPYNLFQMGGVTEEQLNYLQAPAFSSGEINQRVASASLVGVLPDSIRSPLAQGRIGVSAGVEYRREHLDFAADGNQSTGQLNGGEGAALPVDGNYSVREGFAELQVPLIEDAPFVKSMNLGLAYRYSDYSMGIDTNTYKVSTDWQVVDSVMFRAGYNRAARAPNVIELFAPQTVVLAGSTDPCAGLTAGNPLVARCAQIFNLSEAQVLTIERDPAGQYRSLTGGNPDLDAETADTYTAGVILNPSWAPSLSITADYFYVEVKDFISGIGANNIQNGCMNGTTPSFCDLIQRDAIGSLRSSTGYVIDVVQNTGGLKTSGVDFSLDYRQELDSYGSLSLNVVGTWLEKLETQSLVNGPTIDCAGLYGAVCSTLGGSNNPNPTWRHKVRLSWALPFEGSWFSNANVSLAWRFIDSVSLDRTSSQAGLGGANPGGPASDLKLGARNYFDLAAGFNVGDGYSVRLGVNNLFDKDPPLAGATNCPTGPCNGNIYTQVYDSLGRYGFLGLTAEF